MSRINGILQDFEDKKTKTGDRYTRFKINDDWYSCFNQKVSEKLKTYEKKPCSVEIKTVGKFSNIDNVYDDVETEDNAEVQVQKIETKEKPTTDRVDRAKALECAIVFLKEAGTNKTLLEVADQFFNYITEGKH